MIALSPEKENKNRREKVTSLTPRCSAGTLLRTQCNPERWLQYDTIQISLFYARIPWNARWGVLERVPAVFRASAVILFEIDGAHEPSSNSFKFRLQTIFEIR